MIPYGRQDISESDIDAVVEVLRSDFITQGSVIPRFEQSIANYCGAHHAVAVNSATSALHIACMALDVRPGDSVWTSPNTFVASANCALYCGAKVDFVDIDSRSYNMSVEKLEEKLWSSERLGLLPKVVIPVHFAGQPCDMPAIFDLSRKYGFKVIEDASHAIGASYATITREESPIVVGKTYRFNEAHEVIRVGSCQHSDITVFSFHPVKIITTGEGGAALTNSEILAQRMRRLRTHGITNDRALMQDRPAVEIWNYQQIELGFNYRMTDIQASLGLSQLKRLDEFVRRRHEISEFYNEQLKELPLTTPWQAPGTYSSFHLYPIRIRENKYEKKQRNVYEELWDNDVAANVHYIPVHLHPVYQKLGFKIGDFPEAEKLFKDVISIPIYAALERVQQAEVIRILKKILG